MTSDGTMSCAEVLERATAHMDGALEESERLRFERHIHDCPTCRLTLAELRAIVRTAGELRPREGRAADADVAAALALFRRHGLHAGRPREADVPLGIGGHVAARGDHIAYLIESEPGIISTAGFLAEGLARDEVGLLLGTEAANARVLEGLRHLGIDTAELERLGHLVVEAPRTTAAALLDAVDRRIRTAVDRGLPGVRVLGGLGWGVPGWPAHDELLILEARVTDAVRRYPTVVLCAYDGEGAPAIAVHESGLACHPMLLQRGELRSNESYVPAETFLAGLGLDGR